MGLLTDHLDSPDPAPAAPVAATARRGWAGLGPPVAGSVGSVFIILTGAAVRRTQSGLRCPDWPQCTAHSLVAGGDHGDSLIHRWIEFGNRLVTDAIFVIAVLVFVAAW